MRKKIKLYLSFYSTLFVLIIAACNNESDPGINNEPPPVIDEEDSTVTVIDSVYDIDTKGIPQFAEYSYINLDSIYKISRFRSGIGHDYSDGTETCRSMKHYFFPSSRVDWSKLEIISPVEGVIVRAEKEQSFGTQIWIKSLKYPAFNFVIFHVASNLKPGDSVTAGEIIGHHIGTQTTSDIAVNVMTPQGFRLISFFDTMTDSLFNTYRGNSKFNRSSYIITKEERDNNPLTCNGESFINEGTIENWVIINP